MWKVRTHVDVLTRSCALIKNQIPGASCDFRACRTSARLKFTEHLVNIIYLSIDLKAAVALDAALVHWCLIIRTLHNVLSVLRMKNANFEILTPNLLEVSFLFRCENVYDQFLYTHILVKQLSSVFAFRNEPNSC